MLAPLAGALITLMNSLNSRLVARAGSLATLLTVHLVGMAALAAIVAARAILRWARPRRNGAEPSPGQTAKRGALPLYAYLGGVIGVGTVFTSTYSYGALGASLAVALGLIGQTTFSLAVDATGAFGRQRRPLAWRRLPGIALIAAGAACMAGNWRGDLPAIAAAFLSGSFVGASSVFNSRMGRERGLLRATGTNYLTGLSTALVVIAFTAPKPAQFRAAADAVLSAGPVFALGGGLMGVVAVGAMSFPLRPPSRFRGDDPFLRRAVPLRSGVGRGFRHRQYWKDSRHSPRRPGLGAGHGLERPAASLLRN